MIYQICDVMMGISTWGRLHFWMFPLNHNLVTHQTRSIDWHKQGKYCSEIFKRIWRTWEKFQALFQFRNLLQLLNNELCQVSRVLFIWKDECEKIKNDKYELLKTGRSRYIVISLKLQKVHELVPTLWYWAKNTLEMFVIKYTSIWPNLILTVLTIQKKLAIV